MYKAILLSVLVILAAASNPGLNWGSDIGMTLYQGGNATSSTSNITFNSWNSSANIVNLNITGGLAACGACNFTYANATLSGYPVGYSYTLT